MSTAYQNDYIIRDVDTRSFIEACRTNNIIIIKNMVRKGVDISFNKNDGLKWACINGHIDIVKYLINIHRQLFLQSNFLKLEILDLKACFWNAYNNGHMNVVCYLTKRFKPVIKVITNFHYSMLINRNKVHKCMKYISNFGNIPLDNYKSNNKFIL